MVRKAAKESMRTSRARQPNERGFTLLELSVVLMILGLMAVLLYPKLSGLLAEEDLRLTALRLAATIERVREQAAAAKRPYRLNYSLDTNEVWVSVLSDEDFVDDASVFSGRKTLPEGIRLADVSTPGLGTVSEGEGFTTFHPNGYVDASAIHLEDARGQTYSLIINPLTGRTTVYDRYVEQRTIPDLGTE